MKNTHLLLASASLCVAIQTAHAEERIINFNIPAQSAASALDALASQSDLQMLFNRESLKNNYTSGVVGQLTAREALQKLLAGTGLTYTFTANDAVAVKVAESGSDAASTLPAVKVLGQSVYDSADPYNPDYHRTNAYSATKSDAPIMETPYSVAVIPQQVLKDQQVIRVEEAVQNVAGVKANFTSGGLFDAFSMRGFQYTNLYRDGFLLPEGQGASDARLQTANVERVEVLKGPGSILFGRNEPGGIINLVTKRPQATPYHSIQQQFGSYDFYRTAVDSTGAITSDDSLLYRVNLSYENANSFRDFVKTDTVFFAPSLTWNISDKTQANLDITYQHFDDTTDSGRCCN